MIGELYGVNGKKFQRQYKKYLSEFETWDQKSHAEDWLVFPENICENLSLDEVALSDGELYTVASSKQARGKKKSIVAIAKGTQSETVIEHFKNLPKKLRKGVKEITLDMAGSMRLIATRCFPNAIQTIDRFHVQKLALDALQDIRIKYRWQAIDLENEQIAKAKETKTKIAIEIFENGDTLKQLLARSRYLLYKSSEKWTESQKLRAKILFALYPDLHQAYRLTDKLRHLYNQRDEKSLAMTKFAHWFKDVEAFGNKAFSTLLRTIMNHYSDILNYFNNRATNASAESLNAKIKNFRTQLRGVKDKSFFLYRLTRIYG